VVWLRRPATASATIDREAGTPLTCSFLLEHVEPGGSCGLISE
jgi:hypothetical protein